MAHTRWFLALVLLAGCAPDGAAAPEGAAVPERPVDPAVGASVQAVRGSVDHLKVLDPGLPPHESPRHATLWTRQGATWQPAGKVLDVALAGRAILTPDGRLSVDDHTVATQVHPPLVEAADGRLAFAAGPAPETDVFVLQPGAATAERRTTDTQSSRPTWLPDGDLLWVSGAGGVVGFVREGRRLTNPQGTPFADWAPVPAYAARTTVDAAGRVRFHAGTGWFTLDVASGAVEAETAAAEAAKAAEVAP